MASNIKYSIIVPCYNSGEATLSELIERIKGVFQKTIKESYEIILVEDRSVDERTWPVVRNLAEDNAEVRSFRLSRNFGKLSAVMCGYQYSRGDFILMMDDDLQHSPEDIPLLIEQKSHAIVMANFKQRQAGIFARFGSYIWNWFMTVLINKPRHVYMSPFNLVNRYVIDAILKMNVSYPMIGAMMLHVTRDISMVEVKHCAREEGRSGYTLGKKITQFSNLVINNSSLLLRLVAYIGFIISSISFFTILYLVFAWFLWGGTLMGWTSLMVVVLFIGGAILASIGVIGEYLFRIINGIESRPAYVVAEHIDR